MSPSSDSFGEALTVIRADARVAAARWLAAHGFVSTGEVDEWAGALRVAAAGTSVPCTIRLPVAFPDALPEVFITQQPSGRRIAHVEISGKICIAPSSGTMIDGARPERVLADALALAAAELQRGLTGLSDPDLAVEYLAYWPDAEQGVIDAFIVAEGAARPLARARRMHGSATTVFVAESEQSGAKWAAHVGDSLKKFGGAFLLPMMDALPPPDPGTMLTVQGAIALLLRHAMAEDCSTFRRWLNRATFEQAFPLTVVMMLPEHAPGDGRALVALDVSAPTGEVSKRAKRGFRVGHVPASRVLAKIGSQPTRRCSVRRLDGPFLLTRGGAHRQLLERNVTVVGIGAVGSELAAALAAAGVGHISLIDPDTMNFENVHRHVLGMDSVGSPKADALACLLTKQFPHLVITGYASSFEACVAAHPEHIRATDLLVLATGEETDELRINALLADGPPRLHAWLDPIGLAGHVLLGGVRSFSGVTPGCYACVLAPDAVHGFVNRLSLIAPGQQLQRSYAGCAGTFNPFPASAARRTALEAADLAVAFLTGTVARAQAVSWRAVNPPTIPVVLSRRAKVVAPGAVVHLDAAQFASDECQVCGSGVAD